MSSLLEFERMIEKKFEETNDFGFMIKLPKALVDCIPGVQSNSCHFASYDFQNCVGEIATNVGKKECW